MFWCVTDIIARAAVVSTNVNNETGGGGGDGNDNDNNNNSAASCGCTIKNRSSYPEFSLTNPCPAIHPILFKDMAFRLKSKLPENESLARAIFGIIWSESSKIGSSATTGKFKDAGGFNYSGIQTDSGRWGGGASAFITGKYSKKDSKRCREFASFSSLNAYLDFMISRAEAKGFNGFDNDKWTKTYICKWWNPSQCSHAVPGDPIFILKKSWYKAAMKRWNALNVY
jgi:hypothetical protein